MSLAALIAAVTPIDVAAATAARARNDGLAKPPGSLGRLEDLAATLAGIAGACPPPVPAAPCLVICAADHGVVAQGVSRWPQEVTAAMLGVFVSGTAASSALAATVGARVIVADLGVATPTEPGGVVDARIRPGTADLSREPAMARDEARRAILAGAAVARGVIDDGADLIALGDMGIGNTTAAACVIAAFTGRRAEDVTGRGAGADDAEIAHKTAVVAGALALHHPDPGDPLGVVASLGGLEHAGLVGVILAAAGARVPVLLDGVNTNAAALVAVALCPAAIGYLIAGHLSTEPGATHALAHLELSPLLDLHMRLGEGTGALVAVPIVRAAAAALTGMALLSDVAP